MNKKPTVIFDVDGTLADLVETLVEYMKKKGELNWIDRILFSFYKLRKKTGRKYFIHRKSGTDIFSKRFRKVYEKVEQLISDESSRKELRDLIERSIYPESLEKLREAKRHGARVVLLSGSPHHVVKLFADIIKEKGIDLDAYFGTHPVTGTKKENAVKLYILPSEWMEGPVVWIDNVEKKEDLVTLKNTFPHIHSVFVHDRWIGKKGERDLREVNIGEEIEKAVEKWKKFYSYRRGK